MNSQSCTNREAYRAKLAENLTYSTYRTISHPEASFYPMSSVLKGYILTTKAADLLNDGSLWCRDCPTLPHCSSNGGPPYEEKIQIQCSQPRPQVKELIASTQYDVVRRHTIQSDNTPHRVTIAIIDLNPVFEYECVPKCSPYAYLKAKVKNTSPYALLAGQTSIFLDNNFCAKSEIKAVAPLEDFKCNLGADHAIKITYKPMQKSRESGSVVSKCTQWTHKQSIEVRNTHAESVKILIMDQLPLSTEEKIKVNLIEPVIKHPEKYDRSKPIRLNKHNNVEWSVDIGAGETKELTLKYQVEHPTTEEVEASVLHVNKIVESTA